MNFLLKTVAPNPTLRNINILAVYLSLSAAVLHDPKQKKSKTLTNTTLFCIGCNKGKPLQCRIIYDNLI